MAIDTSTFEGALQTKLDAVTDAKEMLLLGKALESTVGSIAVSDITTEGNTKVAAVNTAGTTQVSAVNSAGTTQVAAVNAIATGTFKTVGGSSILGSGDIATLPSGGSAGQVVKKDGSNNPGWADDEGGKILQVLRHAMYVATISIPGRNNSYANMRQVPSQTITVTTTAANSKILITGGVAMRSSSHTHDYFDMKRTLSSNGNTEWLSKLSPYYGSHTDGLIANHTGNINDSTNAAVTYLLSPNVPAGTTITFTYWVGAWDGGTVWWNEYGNGNAHGITEFIYQEVSA
jgi:hypothetical protein